MAISWPAVLRNQPQTDGVAAIAGMPFNSQFQGSKMTRPPAIENCEEKFKTVSAIAP
ncbi:MAG: hypothetical protein AAF773_28440 [Cyanobacteria bacterium P01_D01_bin.115]